MPTINWLFVFQWAPLSILPLLLGWIDGLVVALGLPPVGSGGTELGAFSVVTATASSGLEGAASFESLIVFPLDAGTINTYKCIKLMTHSSIS